MAYVYQHIRLDRNEVFYVGIGSDSKNQRAFNKLNRTKFWKSVLAKTEIKVERKLEDWGRIFCRLTSMEKRKNRV